MLSSKSGPRLAPKSRNFVETIFSTLLLDFAEQFFPP